MADKEKMVWMGTQDLQEKLDTLDTQDPLGVEAREVLREVWAPLEMLDTLVRMGKRGEMAKLDL